MRKQKQFLTYEEATPASRQHLHPCLDCPFARIALPGWLGDFTPQDWINMAHGETRIECHTRIGPQCAGAAIYRANVAKKPRDRSQLLLPRDTTAVFGSPKEFIDHHEGWPYAIHLGSKRNNKLP